MLFLGSSVTKTGRGSFCSELLTCHRSESSKGQCEPVTSRSTARCPNESKSESRRNELGRESIVRILEITSTLYYIYP